MVEEKQSFLEILNEYFAQIQEGNEGTQQGEGTKKKVTIPMEYIFTKKLDRAIIEKAFINLICKANKSYKGKMRHDKDFYGKISCLDIETTQTGTNLVINARDGWTKVVITGDKDLRGPFWATSEDKLYEEVLRSYNMKSIGEICQKYNLTMEERQRFIDKLKEPQINDARKDSIIDAMTDAAKNFIEYYKYLMRQKRIHEGESLEGAIQQRVEKSVKGAKKGKIRDKRKSEIYDFNERAQILEEMEPEHIISIDKIEADNSVSKFAYTTYVYKNPRDRQGYLFVAEPLEGNHNTRMRFVPQEEYDTLQVAQGQNKLVHLTEQFLEMSDSEFSKSRFAKKFKHTSIESLRARYRRVILGERMPSDVAEMQHTEIDKILYDGERKVQKDSIKGLVQDIRASQASDARAQLYGRQREENEISTPQ